MGGRTVWGMEIRSAVAGAFATVAVAGLVFTAVAVSNAQEPAPLAPVAVAGFGHYSTVESQDPIVYVPAPVAVEPVAPEPVVVPEVATEAPAPVPAVAPAPVVEPVPGTMVLPYCEYPPEGYTGILVDGLVPDPDGMCQGRAGHSEDGVWIFD